MKKKVEKWYNEHNKKLNADIQWAEDSIAKLRIILKQQKDPREYRKIQTQIRELELVISDLKKYIINIESR